MALSKFKNFLIEHKGPIISGLTSATVASGLHYLSKKELEKNYPSQSPKIVIITTNRKALEKLLKGDKK